MTGHGSDAPASLIDAVRARIAPLFPDWTEEQVEVLVRQMAALEWRYSAGGDTRSNHHSSDRRKP